jgi:large subunit ribosomal protein L25
MKLTQLKTEPRSKKGSAESRRIRRAGRVPAVVYGLGQDPYPCTVDGTEFSDELQAGHRAFNLVVGGKTESSLLQAVQYDAFGEAIVHLDFKRIDLTKKVRVTVPLHFVGIPEITAVGVVDHVAEDVLVECLPTDIPAHLEVSIAGLALGAHVEAKDVPLPAGVALVTDGHAVLVSHHYKASQLEAADAAAAAESTAQPEMLKEKKDAPGADAKAGDKKDAKK